MKNSSYSDFNDPCLDMYFSSIERYPLLSRNEEIDLANKMKKGDKNARELFINSNLRFVIHIAKRYRTSKLPLTELISAGNVGLIDAVDRFDPSKDIKFSSYAVSFIKKSIFDTMYLNSNIIRVPLDKWKMKIKLEKLIKNSPSDSIDMKKLSEYLEYPINKIEEIQSMPECDFSLSKPLIKDGEDRIFFVESPEKSPEEVVISEIINKKVYEEIESLPEREKEILFLRLGLKEESPLSLREVGEKLGITYERVRQIEKNALSKLHPFASSILN